MTTTGLIDDVQKVVSESVSEATTITTEKSVSSIGGGIDPKLLDTEPISTSSSNNTETETEQEQQAQATDQEEPPTQPIKEDESTASATLVPNA